MFRGQVYVVVVDFIAYDTLRHGQPILNSVTLGSFFDKHLSYVALWEGYGLDPMPTLCHGSRSFCFILCEKGNVFLIVSLRLFSIILGHIIDANHISVRHEDEHAEVKNLGI